MKLNNSIKAGGFTILILGSMIAGVLLFGYLMRYYANFMMISLGIAVLLFFGCIVYKSIKNDLDRDSEDEKRHS